MFTNILVPTDGSPLSRKAAAAAVKLAKALDARITGVHATPAFEPLYYEDFLPTAEHLSPAVHKKTMQRNASKVLGAIEKMCVDTGVSFDAVHVPDQDPHAAIIRVARRKRCDLILMASHGRRGLAGLVLGSETQKVLTHTKTPVMVYR